MNIYDDRVKSKKFDSGRFLTMFGKKKKQQSLETLITDGGVTEKKDVMGHITIGLCTAVMIFLIILGVLAVINA